MPWERIVEGFLTGYWGAASLFLFGTLWGSFANVCIYRWPPSEKWPRGRSVVVPGSHCFACGGAVRWYDNIPILSYLWLRGRCRDCRAQFSARYVWVEFIVGVLFVVVAVAVLQYGYVDEAFSTRLVRYGVFVAFAFVLTVVAFIDLDHRLILDKLSLPSIPIFYGLGLLLPENRWADGLWGAIAGYVTIRAISDVYRWLTGRFGMGHGDAKLLAIVGALLGWKAVFLCILVASGLGTVIETPRLLWVRSRSRGATEVGDGAKPEAIRLTAIPFGPYLAFAGLAVALWRPHWEESLRWWVGQFA